MNFSIYQDSPDVRKSEKAVYSNGTWFSLLLHENYPQETYVKYFDSIFWHCGGISAPFFNTLKKELVLQ